MTKLKNITDQESKHGSKTTKRHYISKSKPAPEKNNLIKLPLLQPCAQNLLVQNLTVCNKAIAKKSAARILNLVDS